MKALVKRIVSGRDHFKEYLVADLLVDDDGTIKVISSKNRETPDGCYSEYEIIQVLVPGLCGEMGGGR